MAKFFKFKQAGDTIVEVMAAIAVMGLALGAAYALSNRAFHTAQNTDERVEALALAQGQIEFLRNTGLNGSLGNLLANYKDGTPFCFRDDNGSAETVATDSYCNPYGQPDKKSLYDISITYCDGSGGCAPVNVFTMKATWIGLGGGQNNLTLYYKPPS